MAKRNVPDFTENWKIKLLCELSTCSRGPLPPSPSLHPRLSLLAASPSLLNTKQNVPKVAMAYSNCVLTMSIGSGLRGREGELVPLVSAHLCTRCRLFDSLAVPFFSTHAFKIYSIFGSYFEIRGFT